MNYPLHNQEGKEVGTIELPDGIFGVRYNSDLVHQVLTSIMSNRRSNLADTKGRGEVRGGGKKPWKQKGTGRARHGSIRSPIWKGGGVTFGPKAERNFDKKINKKMKAGALYAVLSRKAKNAEIRVVDTLSLQAAKTKHMARVLGSIIQKPKTKKKYDSLVVLPKSDAGLIRASRNLPKVMALEARNIDLYNVLNHKFLVMTKDALEVMAKNHSA